MQSIDPVDAIIFYLLENYIRISRLFYLVYTTDILTIISSALCLVKEEYLSKFLMISDA